MPYTIWKEWNERLLRVMRSENEKSAVEITRMTSLPFSQQKILILEYLASGLPFANYGLRNVLDSIHAQLATRSYAVALVGDALCGYIGWVTMERSDAEAWHSGDGSLRMKADGADAAAITILAVTDPDYSLPLVRFAFRELAGKSIYWKRHVPGRGLISRQIDRA